MQTNFPGDPAPSLCVLRLPQAPCRHARPSAPTHGPAGGPAAPGGAPGGACAAGPPAPPASASPPLPGRPTAPALSGAHEGKDRTPCGSLARSPQAPSLPSAPPRPRSQSSTPCPFLGGRPCPQLSMDTPMPELPVGQQEQELRQLLNKDKSKRSKDRGLACWCALPAGVHGPPSWALGGSDASTAVPLRARLGL